MLALVGCVDLLCATTLISVGVRAAGARFAFNSGEFKAPSPACSCVYHTAVYASLASEACKHYEFGS